MQGRDAYRRGLEYSRRGQVTLARMYFGAGVLLSKKHMKLEEISDFHYELAKTYDPDSPEREYHSKESLKYNEKNLHNLCELTSQHYTKGNKYSRKEDNANARQYFLMALDTAHQYMQAITCFSSKVIDNLDEVILAGNQTLSIIYYYVATTFFKQNDHANAIFYMVRAFDYSPSAELSQSFKQFLNVHEPQIIHEWVNQLNAESQQYLFGKYHDKKSLFGKHMSGFAQHAEQGHDVRLFGQLRISDSATSHSSRAKPDSPSFG